MKRPEPRYTVWVRVGDVPHFLKKHGVVPIFARANTATAIDPLLKATLIVHRPRIKSPRKKVKLVGAAAAAVKAKKARAREG